MQVNPVPRGSSVPILIPRHSVRKRRLKALAVSMIQPVSAVGSGKERVQAASVVCPNRTRCTVTPYFVLVLGLVILPLLLWLVLWLREGQVPAYVSWYLIEQAR